MFFPWKAQALCGFQRSFIFDFPGFTFMETLLESTLLDLLGVRNVAVGLLYRRGSS